MVVDVPPSPHRESCYTLLNPSPVAADYFASHCFMMTVCVCCIPSASDVAGVMSRLPGPRCRVSDVSSRGSNICQVYVTEEMCK